MLFDTHAHYDDSWFDADRDALLRSMQEHNVGLILNPGCDVETSKTAVRLAHTYDFMYAAVGIHPEYSVGVTDADIDIIRTLAADPKVKAIGEIGLLLGKTFTGDHAAARAAENPAAQTAGAGAGAAHAGHHS